MANPSQSKLDPPDLTSNPPPLANPGSLSFAATVASICHPLRPRFKSISLPSRQVGSKDGKPAISFTGAEIGAGAKRFEFSLIAKFTVGRPPVSEIQKTFQSNWVVSGRATISEIWDSRHILIILDSEEDIRSALSSSLRKVGHAYFRLFRWTPEYSPKEESKVTPVWVRLPGLPLPLYDSAFIEAIVSTFGDFVGVDEKTKACVAVKTARACVELDVTQSIPNSVWISMPENQGFWQSIIIETKLSYCSNCHVHGHELAVCKKAQKNTTEPSKVAVNSNSHKGSTSVAKKGTTGWVHVTNGKDNNNTLDHLPTSKDKGVFNHKGHTQPKPTDKNPTKDDTLAIVVFDKSNGKANTKVKETNPATITELAAVVGSKVSNVELLRRMEQESCKSSAEVFPIGSSGVFPAALSHYIQDKANATIPPDNIAMLDRTQSCTSQGSKHCSTTVSS